MYIGQGTVGCGHDFFYGKFLPTSERIPANKGSDRADGGTVREMAGIS